MWHFQTNNLHTPENWHPTVLQVESAKINNDALFELLEKITDAVSEISGTEVSFVEIQLDLQRT